MGTRDWVCAEWKLSRMLQPDEMEAALARSKTGKPLDQAITTFLTDCERRNLDGSTLTSYRNTLKAFDEFCSASKCFETGQISIDLVTQFRATRKGKTQKQHAPECEAAKKRAGRRRCNCPV